MKFLIAILILISFSFKFQNETWKTIAITEVEAELSKVQNFYKTNTSYSVTISHASFVGHNATTPFEKMDGYIIKNGINLSTEMVGIKTIQNQKYKVVIDTATLTIGVANPDKDANIDAIPISAGFAKNNIKLCKKTELSGGDKLYRIEFNKNVSLSAEEMLVGKDGRLKELTMYYREAVDIETVNKTVKKEQPKVKISFGDYKLKPKTSESQFAVANYFSEDKNKKLHANANYKKFELLDLRISK